MDPALPIPVDDLLEHAGWIRRLARRLVEDAAAADDLVQETLLAALRLRPERERPLRPWLARVVRAQAALHARGERHRRTREERSARDEALPSSDELAARAELQKQLVQAVLELCDPYRSVLLLRYYEDVSPEEIARRQGVPGSTVRNQIARGLAQLRARLDAVHGGDRRAWSLALVPLAVERDALIVGAGLTSTLIGSLIAMPLIAKLFASSLIAVTIYLAFLLARGNAVEPAALLAEPSPDEVTLRPEAENGANVASAAGATRTAAPLESASEQVAPLRGRVLDADTGEPLADFELVARAERGEPEKLITDAAGNFASERFYTAGRIAFTWWDVDETSTWQWTKGLGRSLNEVDELPQTSSMDWEPASAPIDLRVAVGPRLYLVLSPDSAASAQSWSARLYDRDPCGQHAMDAASVGVVEARVRMEPSPWVRLPRLEGLSLGGLGDVAFIELRSADGLWVGSRSLDIESEGTSTPIEIAVERAARLAIDVTLDGEQDRQGVFVDLVSLADGCSRDSEPRVSFSDLGVFPPFDFRALRPGRYQFVARCDGYRPEAVDLELGPGEVQEREIRLFREQRPARLRGELRSRTGTFSRGATVALRVATSFKRAARWSRVSRSTTSRRADIKSPFGRRQV